MKRDFSVSANNEFIRLICEVENEKWCDFTDWIGDGWYGFQEWIGVLNIEHYIKDVNSYHKKVIDKNNTAKETIDAIFADVRNIDKNYMARFAAYKTRLELFINLVDQFSNVVSPSNGSFDPGNLPSFISQFKETDKYLKKIGGDGLTEDDVKQMDDFTKDILINNTSSILFALLPNVAIGEEIEIPLGPEVTFYYSATGSTENESPIDFNYVVEEQRMKLEKMTFTEETIPTFGTEFNSDGEIVFFAMSGKKGRYDVNRQVDKRLGPDAPDTYSWKITASVEEVAVEKSVTTETENGSVTSAVGIKKSNKTDWTPVPVPVPASVPVKLPRFEVPDWEPVDVNGVFTIIGSFSVVLLMGGLRSLDRFRLFY